MRELTSSGHGIEVLRAPAGAGKTFALDAARESWQRSEVRVIGCALSAQAARELHDQAGIDTTTVARLKSELDRGQPLPAGGVLIVDEAGMVGTRELSDLAGHADRAQAKLLLVGDDRQLPEIEAGGAFRSIADRHGAIELTEVHRQHADWDRDALASLRAGNTGDWARAYVQADRVVTAPTAPAVRAQLVADWWQAEQQGADARMIALRRADVADLNQRARQHMRDAGRLHGEDIEIAGRSFAAGDKVVVGHNDRSLGVLNGDRGDITDAQHGHLDVELDRGDTIRLPRTFARDGHLDHGYATTAHKAQGATVDQAFVLGSDEAYREWGYTALSRHRDSATYYLTTPNDFLNRDPAELTDHDELTGLLTRGLADSRRKELALEAIERHAPETPSPLHDIAPSALDHGLDMGM